MQKNNSVKVEESLLNKIISVAYGDAGLIDRINIYRKARKDPFIKQLLNEYKKTAASVHSIKETELPASISSTVRENLGKNTNTNPVGSFIYSWLFARPILSTGVAGILIIAICGILLFHKPAPEYTYTKVEIELAQKQLQESIAILNKVFRKAETELDTEVMPIHVGKQVNKSFNLLNDLLIGG
ncbi:MAG: hypothetical protein JSW63_04830 [Ignavibacterium sp.]|nr:MAG: hypothetical protein JSW63_04830 [Ignavibacterium sp.]